MSQLVFYILHMAGLLLSDIVSAHSNSTQWFIEISLEAFSERLSPDIGLLLRTSCPEFVIITCEATDDDKTDFYRCCTTLSIYDNDALCVHGM